MKLPFTKKWMERLQPFVSHSGAKAKEYSDQIVRGLKLEHSTTGSKNFWFKSSLDGVYIKIKVGEFPYLSVEGAREIASKYRAMIDQKINPKLAVEVKKIIPTMEEFMLNDFLPWAFKTKRSAAADESKIRIHLIPAFGDRLISEITRRDVEMYLVALKETHSGATTNRHQALLSIIFGKCVDWGVIELNPARGAMKFREDNHKTTFLKPDEVHRLFDVMKNEPNKVAVAAIQFLTSTGFRRQEALSARWENIDFERGMIYLPDTKSGKPRHVALNDSAIAVLRQLEEEKNGSWVFPGKDPAKPYVNLKKPLERLLAAAGLERIRPHDLRHTFASLLVSEGASLYKVQQLLGHASPKMTARYAHLSPENLRETSQIVSRLVTRN